MFRLLLDFASLKKNLDRARDGLGELTVSSRLETAVAVLLVEAARMDSTFGMDERKVIETLLAQRFRLSAPEVAALLARAETTVADTTQYFPFTHHINQQMTEAEKSEVIEMLWRVAYADGELDPHEDALIRQIAGLIHVTDRERAFARQRALEQPPARGDNTPS